MIISITGDGLPPFPRQGAEIASGKMPGWRPDLVHVHDWQTGLLPAYLRFAEAPAIPSVMTIHNIAFQGTFNADNFRNWSFHRMPLMSKVSSITDRSAI